MVLYTLVKYGDLDSTLHSSDENTLMILQADFKVKYAWTPSSETSLVQIMMCCHPSLT